MSSITTSFFAVSSFSCRDPVSFSRLKLLAIPFILVATSFSGLQVFVSRPQFHVATWLSFPLLNYVSRPHFHVATPFLLPTTLIHSHNWPFMLRHHLFVFYLYSGCDSKLIIGFSSL